MKVNLVAVQPSVTLEQYADSASFRKMVLELSEEATGNLEPAPTLIAFPEAIGFPLLLTLSGESQVLRARSVTNAVYELARRRLGPLAKKMVERRVGPLRALYHLQAVDAYQAYTAAFAEASRLTGATVVAGTIFLPHVEAEASRGVHVAADIVRNTAFTFVPPGLIVDRTHKCYLTAGLESRIGLARSDLAGIHGFETTVGRVGISVCLDGFYASVIERLDGLGASIVVQPSANFVRWDRPWPADEVLCEGDAWLCHGLRFHVQDRMHLRYGVNPMLVAKLWDLEAEGRSSIVANRRYCGAQLEGHEGLLAIANSSDRQEVVKATVTL